jgi:hypothetical protein
MNKKSLNNLNNSSKREREREREMGGGLTGF